MNAPVQRVGNQVAGADATVGGNAIADCHTFIVTRRTESAKGIFAESLNGNVRHQESHGAAEGHTAARISAETIP
jgi:hypothetical protein